MMTKKLCIVGLTGSIGMGKTTTLRLFRALGAQIHSADMCVHDLMDVGGKAVDKVARLCPEAAVGKKIDRKKLGTMVFRDKEKLAALEKIVHPLVIASEKKALRAARAAGARVLILDIPLLFETNSEARCDFIVCVSATAKVQKERVMKRPGMTAKKFRAIIKRQMPDKEKKKRADFVIRSDKGLAEARKQARAVMELLAG